MKHLYPSFKVSLALPYYSHLKRFAVVTAILLSTGFSVFSQELVFQNPGLESGIAGQIGSIYRFPQVLPGFDALVQITGRSSSNVQLQNIDVADRGMNKAFQPQVGRVGNITGSTEWYMEFDIRFVKQNTNMDVSVTGFDVTALDVDGDGLTIKEYVEFYRAQSSSVAAITQLSTIVLSNGASEKDYRFSAPLVLFPDIDTVCTAIMGTTKYERTSKLKLRVGAESLGLGSSNDGIRYNSFWFRSFNASAALMLPVKLSVFNASLVKKNVVLNWTTEQEINTSHFSVQRSTDGKEFTDAAILFTDGNSNASISYSYKDPVATGAKGVLYYRLKMVDLDGRFIFSNVRIINLGDSKGQVELQAFPNPVVNEVRITIPESWQNKHVVYEVYTGGGQLVKRSVNKNASQTEVINMQNLKPGTYLIKALNDSETATQR
ncbi:MAG TPA: T9SS type A sorting domain-containing protein, partial [Chitinophagaceae bacterium]